MRSLGIKSESLYLQMLVRRDTSEGGAIVLQPIHQKGPVIYSHEPKVAETEDPKKAQKKKA